METQPLWPTTLVVHWRLVPLDRMKGPTLTSGATTVTLSTAIALRFKDVTKISDTQTPIKKKKECGFLMLLSENDRSTSGSGDRFPRQNDDCWSSLTATLYLKTYSTRFIQPVTYTKANSNVNVCFNTQRVLFPAKGWGLHSLHYILLCTAVTLPCLQQLPLGPFSSFLITLNTWNWLTTKTHCMYK